MSVDLPLAIGVHRISYGQKNEFIQKRDTQPGDEPAPLENQGLFVDESNNEDLHEEYDELIADLLAVSDSDTDRKWSTGKIILVAFLCGVGGTLAIIGLIYLIKALLIALFSRADPLYYKGDAFYNRSAEDLKQAYLSGQLKDFQLIRLLHNDLYTLMLDFIEDDPDFLFTLYQDAAGGDIYNKFRTQPLSLLEFYLCIPSKFTFDGALSEEQKMFILLTMSASDAYPCYPKNSTSAYVTSISITNVVVNSQGHVVSWDIDITAQSGHQGEYSSQTVSNPSVFIFEQRFEQDLVSLGLDPLVYQPLIDDITVFLHDIYSVSFSSQKDMYHLLGFLFTFFEMDELMEYETYDEVITAVHSILSYFSSMTQDGSLTAMEFTIVKNLAEAKVDEVFQIQALQQHIEDTYGVVIAYDLDIANLFLDEYGGQKIIPLSYKDILYTLTLLERNLCIFPEDLLIAENEDRPIYILLSDHPIYAYSMNSGLYAEIGGYKTGSVLAHKKASYSTDCGIYMNSLFLHSYDTSLLHELMHILEQCDGGMMNYDFQVAFHEHSSPYYMQYDGSNFLSYLAYESAWELGFAEGYGMVHSGEDRATIMESLYSHWDRVMEWINDPTGNYYNPANPDNSNSVFAQKVYMMIQQLDDITGGDTDYAFLESLYSDTYGV
ncbi:hypothetical protein ACFL56_02330 [Candidatus Margulisiibacteriota bacterium]